jgi:hypothetical protein
LVIEVEPERVLIGNNQWLGASFGNTLCLFGKPVYFPEGFRMARPIARIS